MDNNVSIMLWMLIFFVVFYLYIDIRITKLRKEMLSHYEICEKMLTHGMTGSQLPSMNTVTPTPTAVHYPYQEDSFLNLIPSREEIAEGLVNLKNDGTWLAGTETVVGSGFHPNGLEGFNISEDTSYASFEGGDLRV
jgi:hypothetical protein